MPKIPQMFLKLTDEEIFTQLVLADSDWKSREYADTSMKSRHEANRTKVLEGIATLISNYQPTKSFTPLQKSLSLMIITKCHLRKVYQNVSTDWNSKDVRSESNSRTEQEPSSLHD